MENEEVRKLLEEKGFKYIGFQGSVYGLCNILENEDFYIFVRHKGNIQEKFEEAELNS